MKITDLVSQFGLALALLGLISATDGRGEDKSRSDPSTVVGLADGGGQARFIQGDKTKFNEYRDIQNSAVLNDFNLHFDDGDAQSPFSLDFDTKHFLRDDQFYKLSVAECNKFKISLQFDSIPHSFTGRELLFSGAGTDKLSIAGGPRGAIQAVEQTRAARGANPLADTTGGDLLQANTIRALFPQADRNVFKIKREKSSFSLDYDFSEETKGWIRCSREDKSGTRVINAGTYERYPQGAAGITHSADLFMASGAELAEPINYETVTVSAGTGVYEDHYQADVEYTFTNFSNDSERLTWDNPFRSGDASATAAAGGAGNGFNRGRFATGQLSLPPSSHSHDLSFSGGVDLPLNSHFSGSLGVGYIVQETPFVPYTLNSAVSPVAGFDVTNRDNLPRRDLDGLVQNLNQSYVLTSKPVDPLDLTARYRFHQYDDLTNRIRFPGYAAFGESYWRTTRNDIGATVENKPFAYTKHTVDVSADYHVVSPLHAILEGGWEDLARSFLRAQGTEESKIGGRLVYKPFSNVKMDAGYLHYDRSMEGYLPGMTAENPEAIGLVNYDVADRERHKGRGSLHVNATDKLTLGFEGEVVDDTYASDSRFGLKESDGYSGSVDLGYSFTDDVSIHAGYSYQHDRSLMKSGAKDDAFNMAGSIDDGWTADAWNPSNYWNSTITDVTHTFSTGTEIKFFKEKLVLDLSYNLSWGQQEITSENPNGAAKLSNASAQDWPTIRSILHEARTDLVYNITPDLCVGASYLFEVFQLDDFTWQSTSAYMATLTAENTTRYVFSNATYSDYTAHVVNLFLKWKF